MPEEDLSVEITLELSDDKTTYLQFEGGGQAKVKEVKQSYTQDYSHVVVIKGDTPVPTCVDDFLVNTEKNFEWVAEIPAETLDALTPLISSFDRYKR